MALILTYNYRVERDWIPVSFGNTVCMLPVTCPVLQNFSTYVISSTIFEKKKNIEYKMFVLICSTTFVWNISHSKKKWAKYDQKKYIMVFMKIIRYSCRILMKLEFSRRIFEGYSYKISWKYVQWEPSCSNRTYWRTDMTKPILAFRKLTKPNIA